MSQLYKYQLTFDSAWKYIHDDLDDVNMLSKELLNLLNFKNGNFFTLLPNNANLERINEFKWGGILQSNPIQEYTINGNTAYYSIKNSITDQLIPTILNEIKSNNQLSCFLDNVSGSSNENYYIYFSDINPLFYQEEVYFFITRNNISIELILKCLRRSFSFWHSLCVFTKANLNGLYKTITLEKIKEICLKTELVMIGAYDGEGYVFWEKSNSNFFQNLECDSQNRKEH